MRNVGIILVVLLVTVVAVVWLPTLQTTHVLIDKARSLSFSRPAKTEPAPPAAAVTKDKKPSHGRRSGAKGDSIAIESGTVETVHISEAAVSPVVSPILPDPGKIRLGTGRDNLVSQYGKPIATATRMDDGSLLEMLIYAPNPLKGPRTVVELRDGKVIAAYRRPG